jgi:hypothetical protein
MASYVGATSTAPEYVGLSSKALDRMLPLFENWVGSKAMKSAECLVARKGKVVWHKGLGDTCTPGAVGKVNTGIQANQL